MTSPGDNFICTTLFVRTEEKLKSLFRKTQSGNHTIKDVHKMSMKNILLPLKKGGLKLEKDIYPQIKIVC